MEKRAPRPFRRAGRPALHVPSIQRRVQSARAGVKFDVSLRAVAVGRAIPQARATVNALLTIKGRHCVFAAGDRLPRAHFHAQLGFTGAAEFRTTKDSHDSR